MTATGILLSSDGYGNISILSEMFDRDEDGSFLLYKHSLLSECEPDGIRQHFYSFRNDVFVTGLDIDGYGNISILSEMVHSRWISDGTHTDISILSEMLDIV